MYPLRHLFFLFFRLLPPPRSHPFFLFFCCRCACVTQKVVKLVVDPKNACVTVTGPNGSGKTERAIQTVDYVRERDHFESYHWADCDKTVMENADTEDHCQLVS